MLYIFKDTMKIFIYFSFLLLINNYQQIFSLNGVAYY